MTTFIRNHRWSIILVTTPWVLSFLLAGVVVYLLLVIQGMNEDITETNSENRSIMQEFNAEYRTVLETIGDLVVQVATLDRKLQQAYARIAELERESPGTMNLSAYQLPTALGQGDLPQEELEGTPTPVHADIPVGSSTLPRALAREDVTHPEKALVEAPPGGSYEISPDTWEAMQDGRTPLCDGFAVEEKPRLPEPRRACVDSTLQLVAVSQDRTTTSLPNLGRRGEVGTYNEK